jgi:hypothetical protein
MNFQPFGAKTVIIAVLLCVLLALTEDKTLLVIIFLTVFHVAPHAI